MSHWVGSRRLVVAAAIAVLVLAGAGVSAYATSSTVFYGCYNRYIRMIDNVSLGSAARCASSEMPVSWSGTGTTGPQGPSGAAGPSGPQGPSGASGPSGPQGLSGDAASGPSGPQGPTGASGPTGPSGAQGTAGIVGLEGQQCAGTFQYVYGFDANGNVLCDNALGPTTRPITAEGVTLSNIAVTIGTNTGITGSNVVTIAGATSFTINFNWAVDGSVTGTQQLEYGYAQRATWKTCMDGVSPSSSSTQSLTFTTPSTPGTYYIGFDIGPDTGCSPSPGAWTHGSPLPNQYFVATIIVP